jgi:hypothetical protein
MFKPILSALNVAGGGKKFAKGGEISSVNTLTPNFQKLSNLAPIASLNPISDGALTVKMIDSIDRRFDKIETSMSNIKVTNVVTDTSDQLNKVNNIQNEASI